MIICLFFGKNVCIYYANKSAKVQPSALHSEISLHVFHPTYRFLCDIYLKMVILLLSCFSYNSWYPVSFLFTFTTLVSLSVLLLDKSIFLFNFILKANFILINIFSYFFFFKFLLSLFNIYAVSKVIFLSLYYIVFLLTLNPYI